MMKHRVRIFLLILTLSLVAVLATDRPDPFFATLEAKVYKVFDGDTISLKGGEKVRLLGIDTPEIGEPFSVEAKRFTRDLVRYKTVRLEFDVKARDPYARLLAFVYVKTDSGWVLVNAELVRNGLARLLFIDPNRRYREYFEEALHEATICHRGLWGKYPEELTLVQVEADPVRYVTEVVTVCFLVLEAEETNGAVVLRAGDSRFLFHVVIPSASLALFTTAGIDRWADYVGEWVKITGRLECMDVRNGLSITLEHPDQLVIKEG